MHHVPQRGAIEVDRAAHFEHDDSRPLGGERFGQAAGPVLGEGGHPDDAAALAALGRVGRSGLGRGGKKQAEGPGKSDQAGCNFRFHDISSPT